MIWLGILVATLAVGAILWHFGKQPALSPVRSSRDLLRAFTTFEVGARSGGLLFIEHEKSGRFLQFLMTNSAPAPASIDFGFPSVAWSAQWYAPLQVALTDAGFDVQDRARPDGTRFLDVQGLSVPQAVALANVSLPVLGLGNLVDLQTRFGGPVGLADITVYNERLRGYESIAPHA
jgi:hypothetical protein